MITSGLGGTPAIYPEPRRNEGVTLDVSSERFGPLSNSQEPVVFTMMSSATEDRIQQAMYRISRQRTTFLITHRLSQIRWADRILVLKGGEIADQGKHESTDHSN